MLFRYLFSELSEMIFGNIILEISGTKFQNILEFQIRILEISGLWVKNRSLIDLKFWNSRTFFIVEIEKNYESFTY